METQTKQDKYTCSVCINANAINIDERTPLISSNSSSSTNSGNNNYHGTFGPLQDDSAFHNLEYHFNWILVILLFLFFLTGISIATYLLITEAEDFQPEISKFISRDKWNASISNGTLFKISVPSEGVILTDTSDTQTEHCDNLSTCSVLMQNMQYDALSVTNLPDLPYNFVIDDGGNIYEGLGWYNTLSENDVKDQFLVALIGNYSSPTELATNDQLTSLNGLLKFAVDKHVLQSCYLIKVPENKRLKTPLMELATKMQTDQKRRCN